VEGELTATFERAWDAMWTRGDATIVDELMLPDYVRHTPRSGDQRRAELKENIKSLKTAFPDLETVIEDIFGEADRVVVRWRSRGTQTREFMGVPATNKPVEVSGITISRVERGRIAEEWVSWDALEMLYRVGVIPDRATLEGKGVDSDLLRKVHRNNATGVMIVTTTVDGTPRGLVVNAFTSISLTPPLILVCVARTSATYPGLFSTDAFAVNILSREQLDVARAFAISGDESKFDAVAWRPGVTSAPLLDGTCGYFEAETQQRAQAMTHTIFIGHVVAAEQFDRLPLLYMGGRFYDSCGLEELR
jgi:steroid delta-isomerase-like uncharacterized protein